MLCETGVEIGGELMKFAELLCQSQNKRDNATYVHLVCHIHDSNSNCHQCQTLYKDNEKKCMEAYRELVDLDYAKIKNDLRERARKEEEKVLQRKRIDAENLEQQIRQTIEEAKQMELPFRLDGGTLQMSTQTSEARARVEAAKHKGEEQRARVEDEEHNKMHNKMLESMNITEHNLAEEEHKAEEEKQKEKEQQEKEEADVVDVIDVFHYDHDDGGGDDNEEGD